MMKTCSTRASLTRCSRMSGSCAMSPMVYCVREPQTTPFALIGGTTLTGILAAAFGICNESFLTDYARKYGLLRTSTIVVTDKYDAFGAAASALCRRGSESYSALVRGGARRFAARRGDCRSCSRKRAIQSRRSAARISSLHTAMSSLSRSGMKHIRKKSKLEQKLGLAGDIEENEPELEPAE